MAAPGLFDDLIRAALGALILAACVIVAVYDAALLHSMTTELHFNDFGKFYGSARLFLAGRDMYGPSQATWMLVGHGQHQQFWDMNPPHLHLLLLPLAWLPAFHAFLVWAGFSVVSLMAAAWLIVRELRLRVTPIGLLWTALAVAACAPTGTLLVTGQLSWLFLWPATVGWIAVRRGAWTKAAIVWGVLASVKPFLLVLPVYVALRRQWRAGAMSVATITTCYGVGIVVFGLDAHRAWFMALRDSSAWAWAAMNGSLLGLASRTLAPSPYLAPLVNAPRAISLVWLTLSLGGAAVTAWALMQRETDPDRDLLLLLLLGLLVSPLGWIYYAWWLLGPALAVVSARRWTAWFTASASGFFMPVLLTTLGQPSGWLTLTIGSIYTWTLVFAYIGTVAARDSSVLPPERRQELKPLDGDLGQVLRAQAANPN
jgi:alpha-1,2-mannosyltransferase